MPGIDLSRLSGAELRRLLKVARTRGDEALTEQLQAELATRSGPVPRPPPAAAPPPPMEEEASAPMTWREEEPVQFQPRLEPRRRDRGGAPLAGLSLLAAGLAAVALVWGLSGRDLPLVGGRTEATPAPRAMVARTALAPAAEAPAPVAQVEAAPVLPIAPPPPAAEPAPQPPPAQVAKAEPAERPPPRRLDPCATPPTPADGAICGDLGLAELDHELREAYVRALHANVDPEIVGADQDAWRRARDPVSDPQALARLYDRRIRELNAATAAASRAGPPLF